MRHVEEIVSFECQKIIHSCLSRIYLIISLSVFFFLCKRHSYTAVLRLISNFNNKDLILLVAMSPIFNTPQLRFQIADFSKCIPLFND